MLVSEKTLKKAINQILSNMSFQRPEHWNKELDREFKNKFIAAYFNSLKEIESVEVCFGFSLNNIYPKKKEKK